MQFKAMAKVIVQEAWKDAFETKEESKEVSLVGEPSTLTPLDSTPIAWECPQGGICVLDLFGGISTGLAAILQAGIQVKKYVYVEKDETARRVSLHHITQLVQRYPNLLPQSVVQGSQRALPSAILLVGAQDLARVGPIHLVIAGWPCQGHSSAGHGQGLQDVKSRMFWEMLRILRLLQTHQVVSPAYILENVPLLGDARSRVVSSMHQIRA